MNDKRDDHSNPNGNTLEPTRRFEDAGLQLAALRSVYEHASHPEKPAHKEDERISLFWRVFGGAIFSVIALVMINLFNNLSSSIAELRGDVVRANESRMTAVTELRNELSRANDARADLVRKDEFNGRIKNNSDQLHALQQQNNAQNATLTSLKTELEGYKERLSKVGTDLESLRKDEAGITELLKKDLQTTTDAIKRELSSFELLRERTMTQAAELKAARDELSKLRQEVDRNQTQDHERRDRRDAQMKSVDENLKELTRGYQECREKLARLEALLTPLVGLPSSTGTQPKVMEPRSQSFPPESVELAPNPRIRKHKKI